MDRIAFAAMLLLALGLWIQPYLTGTSNNTAKVSASAESLPAVEPAALNPIPASSVQRPDAVIATQSPAGPDPAAIKVMRGQEGFWRLAETNAGVWWLVSPANQPQFLNTVTTVQPYQFGRDKDGIHFVSNDWDGKPGGDGNLDEWAQKTIKRIRGMGFKGLGAWSNPAFHKYDIPISRDLNVTTWIPPASRRIYTPEFASAAEYCIQSQVLPLKDNINLVGYFIDNELDWGDEASGPGRYFDDLPPDDLNRREVMSVIQAIWPDVASFNSDWKSQIEKFSDLDNWKTLPHEHSHAYARLFTAWLSHMSQDYFKITCSLIRKYDPNHLILGVRFRGHAPREVVRASRDWTDVQSLNYYVSDARLDREMFEMMHKESGQPVMITEYSFHSLDGRSGNRNTVGFSAQVLDQRARADGYRLFTTRLAQVPYVVGADWFQWSDEPPSGRSSDGEDVNFGIVDVDDTAYDALAEAVRSTSMLLDSDHARSAGEPGSDVWRESFTSKPVINVPYLTRPPSLNGELSDWPPECRLNGVRHSQTVGLERSRIPLPNVYLGWTDQGIYLGMEIFDNDIVGAPPQGWWWTRDFAEIWISTRPVAPDQDAYDVYSHQFFFVPNAWPGADGLLGTVGQWHRPGDALKENLIPHPDTRSAARVLPDRYVVEMFIPASALNGYDPRNEPAMAFNMHVRNFQHATDYFWSAPKEVMTQLRPGTWGTMYLTPPEKTVVRAAGADRAAPKPQ